MNRPIHRLVALFGALFVTLGAPACGFELDPNLDDYFPCDATARSSEPAQCIDGYTCSPRGFCAQQAAPDCAAYEEGDTRCNAQVVEICRAGAWEADQDCDASGQACVEVARSPVVTFACRSQ